MKQGRDTRKAQTGRGQVRLKLQRRSAPAPSAHEGAQNHRTRRLLKLARQVEDLIRQFHRHATMVGGLSVVPWSMLSLWKKVQKSGEGLLSGACWDVVRQPLFPSLEQVSGLVCNLRDEARQAHEDDRGNRMTTWKTGFARLTELVAIGAQRGLISLIPKGGGSAPQKLRPMGLMASVYRLWASLRVRDIMHWQEKWADTALSGYRPGRRAEDVWMDLSLSVESALVDASDLVGMSIDWSKCFDRVPQGIAFQLADRQDLHPRVLEPLRAGQKVCHGRPRGERNLLPQTASFKFFL